MSWARGYSGSLSSCRYCGRAVIRTRDGRGRFLPADPGTEGDPKGTLAIRAGGFITRSREILAGAPLEEGELRAVAHWDTCPEHPHRRHPAGRRVRRKKEEGTL